MNVKNFLQMMVKEIGGPVWLLKIKLGRIFPEIFLPKTDMIHALKWSWGTELGAAIYP